MNVRTIAPRLAPLALVALACSACGGAAQEPHAPATATPAAPAGPDPTTIEEAQARIDRASAELGGAPPGATPSTPATDAPPEPAHAQPPHAERTDDASACATACRALESMRRSVRVLCELAGDTDERCAKAKDTLTQSEARVAQRSCRCR